MIMTRGSEALSLADKQALVLEGYEALSARSSRMRDLAIGEEWGDLVEEQSRYVIEVERLSRMERDIELDAGQRQRKADLLEVILECDRDVRERLVTRRDQLGELIGVSQRKRDLSRAYRTASGNNVVDAEHAFGPGGTTGHDIKGDS